MKVGNKYRVRYKFGLQQKEREFVGTYLGRGIGFGDLDFDLRPDAGTATLPSTALLSFKEVDKFTPHSQPSIVRED